MAEALTTDDRTRDLPALDASGWRDVEVAPLDLPAEVDPYDGRVYLKARENLHAFMAQGILVQDPRPALYVYVQDFRLDGRPMRRATLAEVEALTHADEIS